MWPLSPALLVAGLATLCAAAPVLAKDGNYATLIAELRKLNERVEKLETRNRELEQRVTSNAAAETRLQVIEENNKQLEKALTTERISDKEPDLATRLKAVEYQALSILKQARRVEALEGISVSTSLTGVVQGVNSGGSAAGSRETRSNYRGDIAVSLPGGKIGDAEGSLFAQVRLGQGNGIGLVSTYTSSANTTAFQVVSATPDDSFAILAQAWYQVKIPLPFGGYKAHSREHLHVTLGKIDPFVFFDQNVAADDESIKFLNNAFVHNPLLDSGGDVGADRYGFSPGAVIAYANQHSRPESYGVSLGIFGSSNGANFSGSPGQPFVIAQFDTTQRFAGLPGNYRVYGWSNAHASDFDGTTRRHTGVGLSADQRVGDSTTLFARYGHQIKGQVRFDRALTLGAEFAGNDWGRGADSVGIAAGFLRTSSEFHSNSLTVDANGDGIPDYAYAASGWERIAELYYRFRLNKQVDVSPDFQYIANPGGNEAASSVKVVSLRARVSY